MGARFCVEREMWLIPTKYSSATSFSLTSQMMVIWSLIVIKETNIWFGCIIDGCSRPIFAVVTDDVQQEHRHVFGMVYN